MDGKVKEFYNNPVQVMYRIKGGTADFAGIAFRNKVISAKSGITISLRDLEYIKEMWWVDISEAIAD